MATALLMIINVTYTSVTEKELELQARHSNFRASVIARDLQTSTEEFTTDWGLNADAQLAPFIKDEQVRVLIFNDVDRVLVDTAAKFRGLTLSFDLLQACRQSKQPRHALYRISDGTEALYSIHPILRNGVYKGAVLRIEESDPALDLSLGSIIQSVAIYGVFLIAVSTAIGNHALRQYLTPLDQLQAGMSAMTRGNYVYRIPEEKEKDFFPLTTGMNILGQRLSEVEEQQQEFIASVSHEIKTPITALKIITETLLESKDTIDRDTVFDFLEDVDKESDRLKEIVEDLLYMMRLEKKIVTLQVETRPINRLLEDTIELMKPLARQSEITIHREFSEKVFSEFDYNRMKQVFINLLGNAIKYNNPGGNIYVTLDEERGRIIIEILDDGWGIPEEDLPYLFQRFYRVDKGRSRKKGGTGLGLAIVREIISLHMGEISVHSEIGKGTRIRVTLPRKLRVT